MKKLITLFLAICILVLNNMAKGQNDQTPALNQLMRKIDTVLQEKRIPGLMISLVKKDSLLFSGGLGYADLQKKVPVDSHTKFHLASITKFFVAMGIQKLIVEGKLNLNDRLQVIAPEVPYHNKWESTHPVKLVHLLEHTAGFGDIEINKMVNMTGKPLTGIKAIAAVEKSLISRWKPGERMSYSNPGYNVLGYIISKVAGIPWNDYIQQHLFKPLAMHGTSFDLNGKNNPTYARGYDFGKESPYLLPFYIPSSNGASSALVSNAADMGKFMYQLLNMTEHNADWLNKHDFAEMEKVHSTLANQNGLKTGYALGNDCFPNNKKVTFRGHNGKGEGFSSWLFFNREVGLAYTISANCNTNLWPVSKLIEDYLTKDMEAPKMLDVKIDHSRIAPMLGYYQFMNPKNERWEFFRRIFEGIKLLAVKGDKLIVEKGNGQIDSLIHTGNGIFRAKGDIISSYVVGYDREGRPFFQGYGSGFYSKTLYFPILFQKMLIYFGLIASVLSILYALIAIPFALFKKLKMIDLYMILLPALGVISFLVSYRLLGLTDIATKELFTTVNLTSIFIFAGMLFFGITVLIASYLLYQRWTKLAHKWIKYPLALYLLGLFYLVVLFSIHGWIGVPIWTM